MTVIEEVIKMKPSETDDPYERLGISKYASEDDIRKAYKKKALEYHPDKHPEEKKQESHLEFIAVSEAYEKLSKKERNYQERETGKEKSTFDYYNDMFFNDFRDFEDVRDFFFKHEKDLLNSENETVRYVTKLAAKFLRGL